MFTYSNSIFKKSFHVNVRSTRLKFLLTQRIYFSIKFVRETKTCEGKIDF